MFHIRCIAGFIFIFIFFLSSHLLRFFLHSSPHV